MATLAEVLLESDAPDGYEVPADWMQGRTAYGGISVALSLQSVLNRSGADLPKLRAGQVNFIAPTAGPLRFSSEILRRGKTASWVEADCISQTGVAVRTMFLFADARPSEIHHQFSDKPEVKAPDAYASIPAVAGAPAYLVNFEIRFAGEAFPMSGAKHPEIFAWVRHRNAAVVHPAVALLALADSLPPAVMSTFRKFAPLSSMTWSFEVMDLPDPQQWFLLRSFSLRSAEGYSFEQMGIWDEQGKPVMVGSQTIAIFA